MLELNFVIPGYYILNESIDSEKKEYIRVLGEDDDKPDHFKIMNSKKSLPEHYILDNYTFSPTAATTNENESSSKLKIGDIEKVSTNVTKQNLSEIPIREVDNIHTQKVLIDEVYNKKPIGIQQPKLSEEEILLRRTLDSVKINEPKSFNFNISINTNYDIEKLLQISKLLNLDVSKIIKIIVEESVNEQIINQLINYNFNKTEEFTKPVKDINIIKPTDLNTEDEVVFDIEKPMTKISNEKPKVIKQILTLEEQNNKIREYINNSII